MDTVTVILVSKSVRIFKILISPLVVYPFDISTLHSEWNHSCYRTMLNQLHFQILLKKECPDFPGGKGCYLLYDSWHYLSGCLVWWWRKWYVSCAITWQTYSSTKKLKTRWLTARGTQKLLNCHWAAIIGVIVICQKDVEATGFPKFSPWESL